jgi:hypothetical protein
VHIRTAPPLPACHASRESEKLPQFCPATMESGKEKDENRREKQQCCGFFATEIIVFIFNALN